MNPREQTLWERISQVAENMRDTPDWKKGSSRNERNDSIPSERERQCESRVAASPSYRKSSLK
jgi:hypothetical protein